jgi:hypothetical protein
MNRPSILIPVALWYLLLPPGNPPDTSVPLNQWIRVGTYDSASECTTASVERVAAAIREKKESEVLRAKNARCAPSE